VGNHAFQFFIVHQFQQPLGDGHGRVHGLRPVANAFGAGSGIT